MIIKYKKLVKLGLYTYLMLYIYNNIYKYALKLISNFHFNNINDQKNKSFLLDIIYGYFDIVLIFIIIFIAFILYYKLYVKKSVFLIFSEENVVALSVFFFIHYLIDKIWLVFPIPFDGTFILFIFSVPLAIIVIVATGLLSQKIAKKLL